MDKFLNEFVKVYKAEYNYLVVMGIDIYEMSSDAHAPNGVNMYVGDYAEDYVKSTDDEEVPLETVTDSMKLAIVDRITFGYNN